MVPPAMTKELLLDTPAPLPMKVLPVMVPPYMVKAPSESTPRPLKVSAWVMMPLPLPLALQSVRVKLLSPGTVMTAKLPLAVMLWPLRQSTTSLPLMGEFQELLISTSAFR